MPETTSSGVTGSADERIALGTAPPAPQALLALLKRQPATSQCARLRKHERYTCSVPITIEVDAAAGPDARRRSHAALIENISAGGFACVCREAVKPGTPIRANFGAVQPGAELRAVVRRCVPTWYGTFRLGVAFVDR